MFALDKDKQTDKTFPHAIELCLGMSVYMSMVIPMD